MVSVTRWKRSSSFIQYRHVEGRGDGTLFPCSCGRGCCRGWCGGRSAGGSTLDSGLDPCFASSLSAFGFTMTILLFLLPPPSLGPEGSWKIGGPALSKKSHSRF